MPIVKIGIPPFFVFEWTDDDFKRLGKAVKRLLKDKDFQGYYHIIAKHSGKA